MHTDDNLDDTLINALRQGFAEDTDTIHASPALAANLRRRHRTHRRRAAALRIALPTSAAAFGGVLLSGQLGGPASTIAAHDPSASAVATVPATVTATPFVPVAYTFKAPTDSLNLPCLSVGTDLSSVPGFTNTTAELYTAQGESGAPCQVGFATLDLIAPPADTHPANLPGVSGLLEWDHPVQGTRTIFTLAPPSDTADAGTWQSYTVSADLDPAVLASWFTRAS